MKAPLHESASADSRPLVLVVEDNQLNARLSCEMLKAGGYRAQVAVTGAEGLRLAQELRPLLIITDLQMPGMDGLAMTRALKADPQLAPIPVMALTAHVMPEHRQQALAVGCAAFLCKPLRLHPFLNEIDHVLQHACAIQ